METLLGSPWVGRAGVTVLVLLEHLQVMSYGNRMLVMTDYSWSHEAEDAFDGLEKLALRFTGTGFMCVYVLSVACSLIGLVLYIALLPRIHAWNRKISLAGLCILFVDYIIFGAGFVPIIAVLSEVQYCDDSGTLKDYTEVKCWERKQLSMVTFGYLGASSAFIMSAVICPILKSERKGVEMRWANETLFPALFKLLEIGIINIFAAVHHGYLGLTANLVLIVYLALNQCYSDIHVASMKMAVLWGQFWVFACAEEATRHSDIASSMLRVWPVMLVIGYVSMFTLCFLRRRRAPSQLPLEK